MTRGLQQAPATVSWRYRPHGCGDTRAAASAAPGDAAGTSASAASRLHDRLRDMVALLMGCAGLQHRFSGAALVAAEGSDLQLWNVKGELQHNSAPTA
jgi:hypothetical protein